MLAISQADPVALKSLTIVSYDIVLKTRRSKPFIVLKKLLITFTGAAISDTLVALRRPVPVPEAALRDSPPHLQQSPGPSDTWWSYHQRNCGGTFVKFKEPENKTKKTAKPKGDITKYVTKKTTAPIGEPKIIKAPTKNPKPPVIKSNNGSTVVTQNGIRTLTATAVKTTSVFTGKANTLQGNRVRSSSVDVAEAVRNIWANKHLPSTVNKPLTPPPHVVRENYPVAPTKVPKRPLIVNVYQLRN